MMGWLNLFFQHRGLEILSTSYAGPRAEPPLRGEPVRVVRNIRVKISNHFYDTEKTDLTNSRNYFLIQISPSKYCFDCSGGCYA